jgi:hypothetical protein
MEERQISLEQLDELALDTADRFGEPEIVEGRDFHDHTPIGQFVTAKYVGLEESDGSSIVLEHLDKTNWKLHEKNTIAPLRAGYNGTANYQTRNTQPREWHFWRDSSGLWLGGVGG